MSRNMTYCNHTCRHNCTGWISLNELLASAITQLAHSTVNHIGLGSPFTTKQSTTKKNLLFTNCFCPNKSLLLELLMVTGVCPVWLGTPNLFGSTSRCVSAGSALGSSTLTAGFITAICRLDGMNGPRGILYLFLPKQKPLTWVIRWD